jgi:hypothetical protein
MAITLNFVETKQAFTNGVMMNRYDLVIAIA